MTNLDVRGTLVEGDDVGLGGVEVGEQLLVLLLLRHAVPAVPLLARRLLLLPPSLHLGKYFCKYTIKSICNNLKKYSQKNISSQKIFTEKYFISKNIY